MKRRSPSKRRMRSVASAAVWSACVTILVSWLSAGSPQLARADAPAAEKPAGGARANQEAQDGPGGAAVEFQKRVGTLVRIAAPLTDNVTKRAVRMAKKAIDSAKQKELWPVIIFEIEPGHCTFGGAYDLADAISQLDGATTVAYVPKDAQGKPQTLRGHAVLLALACDMILMAPDAKIGEAGADEETINLPERSGYVEIAKRRRTAPVDLALGMLDPNLVVYELETAQFGVREFVRSDRLEEFLKETTVVEEPDPQKPLIRQGEAGLFTGAEAKRLGLVRYLVEDRHAVAKVLGLPAESLEEDPSLDGGWRAIQIPIDSELTRNYCNQLERKVQTEIDRGNVNLIVFVIDSPGGSAEASLGLAKFLSHDLNQSQRRTVAYIKGEARGEAAFIALACDHIVMLPEATIGGRVSLDEEPPQGGGPQNPMRRERPRQRVDRIGDVVRDLQHIAEEKGRAYSLGAAFADPNMTVYRYTRKSDGLVQYYSEAEAQTQADPDNWSQGEAVTQLGKPLRLTGAKAKEFGLATDVVDNFDGLKAIYGLEQDPRTVQPGWADTLLEALRDRKLLFALLMIGGAAFYAELQSPGTGVGGLVATVCFLLFFWGTYLDGTAGWLEALLFVLGIVLIVLEVFVIPGFGVFGVGGAMMVLASLVLALQTSHGLPASSADLRELRGSLSVVTGAGVGVLALIALLRQWLPKSRAMSGIMLDPPSEHEQREIHRNESLARFDQLVGQHGVAVTQLTPSGKAKIGGQIVNVITGGELVDRGQAIVVVHHQGSRVVVRGDEG